MREQEINYEEVINLAYRVAAEYLHDFESAQDIAQITAIECFLNSEKLRKESLNSWIYAVSKNKSIDYIRKSATITKLQKTVNPQTEEFEIIQPEDLDDLIETTPNTVVPIKHKELLRKLLTSKYDFKKIGRCEKLNPDTLRKKVYRIQQEILLYHSIMNNKLRIQPIPGTKIHSNLKNFFKKLKKHFNSQDLELFKDFKMDSVTKGILESVTIEIIIEYQLCIEDNKIHQLFAAYFDKNRKFNTLLFRISLDNNILRIRSLPQTPKKIVKIIDEKVPDELRRSLAHGSDGMPKLSEEELNIELFKCREAIEIVYER